MTRRLAVGSRAPRRGRGSSRAGLVVGSAGCPRLRASGPWEPAGARLVVEVRASRARRPCGAGCAPRFHPSELGQISARGAGTTAPSLLPDRAGAGRTCGDRPCAGRRRGSGSPGRPTTPHGGHRPCQRVCKNLRAAPSAAHPRCAPARAPLAGFGRVVLPARSPDRPCGPGEAGSAPRSLAAYAARVVPRNSREERARPHPDATRPPPSALRPICAHSSSCPLSRCSNAPEGIVLASGRSCASRTAGIAARRRYRRRKRCCGHQGGADGCRQFESD